MEPISIISSAAIPANFRAAQGATTKVCFTHSEEERRRDQPRLAVSIQGCGYFLVPLRLSSSQCIKHCFLVAPRGDKKISRNAARIYYRYGFYLILTSVWLLVQFHSQCNNPR